MVDTDPLQVAVDSTVRMLLLAQSATRFLHFLLPYSAKKTLNGGELRKNICTHRGISLILLPAYQAYHHGGVDRHRYG